MAAPNVNGRLHLTGVHQNLQLLYTFYALHFLFESKYAMPFTFGYRRAVCLSVSALSKLSRERRERSAGRYLKVNGIVCLFSNRNP